MIYIQDESIFAVISGMLFSGFIIWWIKSGELKKTKKLEKQGLGIETVSTMRSWRVYLIAGIGFILLLIELCRRLFV